MSELFREAFRAYSAQEARKRLAEIGEYALVRNPQRFREKDIPKLIREIRSSKPLSSKTSKRK